MTDLMRRFWSDDSGQGLTEYALIIALVSIGLIAVLIIFRDELGSVFDRIIDELQANAPGADGGYQSTN